MVDEDEQLRRAVKWRTVHRAERAVGLGDVLSELMEKRISPQQSRAELIAEAWSQLLPIELCRHCRIDGISGHKLKVLADSPSYVYELQLLSSELLEELGRQYPQARIQEIKVVVGRAAAI
ncbi:MAG: DciA family protein [Phycisphaerae bacterium]|nr:DciA family protein [Phycisphaerae bacterium]MDD5380553.1 DciA family protein [Phycisphaerae bacterium]